MEEWYGYESHLYQRYANGLLGYERWIKLMNKLTEWHEQYYGG